MKKYLLAAFLLLAQSAIAQQSPFADIEIIESVPAGTTLGSPGLRRTGDAWIDMIGKAKKTIDIEMFYIAHEPGKQLEPVLNAVQAAADRGVKVRIMVDATMYKTYPETVDSLGRYPNIDARRVDFGKIAGGVQHAKFFIIDGEELFIGSQNFDWRSLEHIHELGLRIKNRKLAEAFGESYEMDWKLSSASPEQLKSIQPGKGNFLTPVRFAGPAGAVAEFTPTFSPKGLIPVESLWDEKAIVDLVDGARSGLTLQFLSYSRRDRGGSDYPVIDEAIRRAAKRGVAVRMIVSDWEKGTPAEAALKSLAALPNVEVSFSVIPEWDGGYISYARVEHCKYIVADRTKFWLGTSNCEKGYFYGSRNLGVLSTSPLLAAALAKIFQKSWDSPYREKVSPEGKYSPREHGERK
jgi:phosphatidylserine/phosphatidylglycerophosphate/cardiolipin synthase-like enzyme